MDKTLNFNCERKRAGGRGEGEGEDGGEGGEREKEKEEMEEGSVREEAIISELYILSTVLVPKYY